MTFRGHTNVEMETKNPEISEPIKDDHWTVQELAWGFLIIVVAVIVMLVVGYFICFKIPHEKPV